MDTFGDLTVSRWRNTAWPNSWKDLEHVKSHCWQYDTDGVNCRQRDDPRVRYVIEMVGGYSPKLGCKGRRSDVRRLVGVEANLEATGFRG